MANTFVDRYILQADDRTKAATASAQANFRRLDQTASALKTTLIGVGAAFVIQRAAGFTRDTVQMAQAIGDVAEKAGITAEQLQVLRFAADQNGSSAQALDKAMLRLNASLGQAGREALGLDSTTSIASRALQSLGINVLDAGGNIRSTGDIFPELVDKLAAIESPAERAALAAQIFGLRLGPELGKLINQGSAPLAKYRDELAATGALLSNELVADASDVADQFSAVGLAIRTNFQRGFLEAFVGDFESLDALVRDPQFVQSIADIGRGFGNAMQAVIEHGPTVLAHLRDIRDVVVAIGIARLGDSLGSAFGPAGRFVGGLAGAAAAVAAVAALRARDAEVDAKREEAAQRRRTKAALDATRGVRDVRQQQQAIEEAAVANLKQLREAETATLQAELDKQKDALQAAVDAQRSARQQQQDIAKEFSDLVASTRGAATPTRSSVVLDTSRAQSALSAGDSAKALSLARQAADAISNLDEADRKSATIRLTAERLQQIANAAAAAQAGQADQAVAQAQAIYDQVKAQFEALKNLPVGFDSAQTITDAQSLRAAIEAAVAQPIVIPVQVAQVPGAEAAAPDVPGRAFGGYVPGNSPHPRADDKLIWATAGELVIGRPEVEALRRQHGAAAIAALLRGRLPGYALGGLVGADIPRPALPSLPASPAPRGGDTINLTLPGGQTYSVTADRDTSAALQRDVRLMGLKGGRR